MPVRVEWRRRLGGSAVRRGRSSTEWTGVRPGEVLVGLEVLERERKARGMLVWR